MRFLLGLYRVGLRAYPRQFRARYEQEMSRVFEERLHDVKRCGRIATVRYCAGMTVDLLISAARERFTGVRSGQAAGTLAAFVAGTFVAFFDFRATEVQATLLVLMTTSLVLGYLVPKRAWRRALIIAALLPAIHLAAFVLEGGHATGLLPYLSRLMMLAPALIACFIGTYIGVLLRFVTETLAQRFRHKASGPPGP